MTTFTALFAVDSYGLLARDGELPWSCSEDLRRFKQLTEENIVIMGRKTWESLPKRPLPNRTNIVVSTTLTEVEGALLVKTIGAALEAAYYEEVSSDQAFFIGGAELLQAAIPYCSYIEMTHIHGDFSREKSEHVFLPENLLEGFEEKMVTLYEDEGFSFHSLARKEK